jgi:CubicO group peptidase (beta-lactamase class C family)
MTTPIRDLVGDPAALAERLGTDAAVATTSGVAGSTAVLRPGSVTKLLTATAVMQCVDDGLLALDDPVSRWVPFLDGAIHVEHLLSHSSGLDAGDVFVDTGDDDDCLARYVALLEGVGQLFPPGHTFSYNNAGMVLAGHIASLVRGATYEDVLRTHIFEPAEMSSAALTAVPGDDPVRTRALAPAGGTLECTAEDLLRFVTASLVKPDSAARMRRQHVAAPGGVVQMAGCGLGWQIWRNELGETVRHGGAYPGHSAIVALDPVADVALAIMIPTAAGISAINAILDPQDPIVTEGPPSSLDAYVGEYASHAVKVAIARAGEGLTAEIGGFPPVPVQPVDRTTFTAMGQPFAFFDFDERGAPRYLRFRMRVQRRL